MPSWYAWRWRRRCRAPAPSITGCGCYGRLGHLFPHLPHQPGYRRRFGTGGLKLYLLTTAEGMPVAWCLADPKIGEREVAADLLGHARDIGALRDAMIVLCDKAWPGGSWNATPRTK